MESDTDEEFAREIRETAEKAESMPQSERGSRFYDRLRNSIRRYVDQKSGVLGKTADYLLLVPDVFILLWRLTTDSRVGSKDKVLLGSAVAYFIFPFDIIPEALVGPMGFLDDLVFGVYVLNKMLSTTDPAVLREHWSGSDDVLETIRKVLTAADSLVGSNMASNIKKMLG